MSDSVVVVLLVGWVAGIVAALMKAGSERGKRQLGEIAARTPLPEWVAYAVLAVLVVAWPAVFVVAVVERLAGRSGGGSR
ncbi:hypothetical protein ACQRET_03690 [Streptomyces koyangensis]|uniref:hypothetical protein n=1 Tax=Streptomyces koyangensis TaxID=188770 RepID=UPI003D008B4C